jgi:hypothetical protein
LDWLIKSRWGAGSGGFFHGFFTLGVKFVASAPLIYNLYRPCPQHFIRRAAVVRLASRAEGNISCLLRF